MDILWNLVSFIVALGILVTFHEYGHFWVARKVGVKILTFSVGFGKPIWQKKGQDGVIYQIAAIPLGGYVKMLGEGTGEDELNESEKHLAFSHQSVWGRIAIVVAGPVANFLLAIVLYWIVFLGGLEGISPVLGNSPKDSIVASSGNQNGDKIIAVDEVNISTLSELNESLARRLGDKGDIKILSERKGFSKPVETHWDITNWLVDDENPELLHSIGFYHALEKKELLIGQVEPGGAADRAGIRAMDQLVKIDGSRINGWSDVVEAVGPNPGKHVSIEIIRDSEPMSVSAVIGTRESNESQGYLGISNEWVLYQVTRKAGFFEAFGLAVESTGKTIGLTVSLFKKLLVGDLSPKSLSGPISIAKGAGQSASIGWVSFLKFLALISVNLGFINLLPVPMLDGGHLMYFVIEAVKGKPLPQKVQEFGLQVGMMMVFALMAIAIFNDFARI